MAVETAFIETVNGTIKELLANQFNNDQPNKMEAESALSSKSKSIFQAMLGKRAV